MSPPGRPKGESSLGEEGAQRLEGHPSVPPGRPKGEPSLGEEGAQRLEGRSGPQLARLGALEIRYVVEGPADAPAVVLAHGLLTHLGMWDAVAARLSREWRVVRYDLRGHGGTTATPPPYAMATLAGDCLALMDHLGISRAHFIGSSLGGMIGQCLGAHAGERFHSLTLANTTARQSAAAAWQQRIDTAAGPAGVGPLVEPTLQRWFTADFLARGGAVIDTLRQAALATDPAGFAGCAAAVRDLDQLHLLESIRLPALVIAGADDTATPPAEAEQLRAGISGARLVTLPAAHQSAVEMPTAFGEHWLAFVARQGA